MKLFLIFYIRDSIQDSVIEEMAKLCSNTTCGFRLSGSHVLMIRYMPDDYFQNLTKINDLISKERMSPLLMTEYKFLKVLEISGELGLFLEDYELSQDDEELFNDLFFSSEGLRIQTIQEALNAHDVSIDSLAFALSSRKKTIKVCSSGLLGVSRDFNPLHTYHSFLMKLIHFLYTGNVNETYAVQTLKRGDRRWKKWVKHQIDKQYSKKALKSD